MKLFCKATLVELTGEGVRMVHNSWRGLMVHRGICVLVWWGVAAQHMQQRLSQSSSTSCQCCRYRACTEHHQCIFFFENGLHEHPLLQINPEKYTSCQIQPPPTTKPISLVLEAADQLKLPPLFARPLPQLSLPTAAPPPKWRQFSTQLEMLKIFRVVGRCAGDFVLCPFPSSVPFFLFFSSLPPFNFIFTLSLFSINLILFLYFSSLQPPATPPYCPSTKHHHLHHGGFLPSSQRPPHRLANTKQHPSRHRHQSPRRCPLHILPRIRRPARSHRPRVRRATLQLTVQD